MSLDEIGKDLQSFLEMPDGGGEVAGMKRFLVAFEFLEGFGGDAELANRDRAGGGPSRGRRIRFGARANDCERIVGIEGGRSIVSGGRGPGAAAPSLRVKI